MRRVVVVNTEGASVSGKNIDGFKARILAMGFGIAQECYIVPFNVSKAPGADNIVIWFKLDVDLSSSNIQIMTAADRAFKIMLFLSKGKSPLTITLNTFVAPFSSSSSSSCHIAPDIGLPGEEAIVALDGDRASLRCLKLDASRFI